MAVARAFHPILGVLEVVLRNRLNDVIAQFFGDKEWIINHRKRLPNHLNNMIEGALKKHKGKGFAPTGDQILAEQTMGFWTELFGGKAWKALQGHPMKAFPHLPKHISRVSMNLVLYEVRKFRNRINHNEPICFRGNHWDMGYVGRVQIQVYDLLGWIDPELLKLTKGVDTISSEINRARKN